MSILKMLREREEPLNVAELAALLRVDADTVLRWARNRQVPSIRIGKVIRFDGSLLADWVELQGACTHPIIRPFLQPRVPGDPEDYQMRWTDLGELAPKEFRSSKEKTDDAKQ
jgi:excisionase family DNA binding protein